jgi:serine/threonine protein kinase
MMAEETLYCRGCNEYYASESGGRCPECGGEMTLADLDVAPNLAETAFMDVLPETLKSSTGLSKELVGRTLGLYELQEFLGRGGMAWVFRARHNTLLRTCAVKVLSPDFHRRKPDSVEMFLSEARAAASLVHPHVVTVHNIGESDGFHFIELEYVDGNSLQRLVKQHEQLAPLVATRYMMQCSSALAAAHNQDLIHRDFKPANILIRTRDNVAKLADFGLAKKIDTDAIAPTSLNGTPYFMAPEMFKGTSASKQSDVYAAGISYYYLLTGELPFASRKLGPLAQMHAESEATDPRNIFPQIPDPAVHIIRQCLAKQPAQRFQDGVELLAAFQDAFTSMRTLTSLVDEALQGLDVSWEQNSGRIAVLVRLSGSRKQTVFIEESDDGPWDTRLVRIVSVCGPELASYYRRALELNACVPHGSLAIEEIDGRSRFVMLNNYPRATCDPGEIRQSVLDIAQWADNVEQVLTGCDEH